MIFNIQRFCLHDGPGIRTTVFLKGCPLRCKWCSNPESQSGKPELMHNKKLCIGCLKCIDACSKGAISLSKCSSDQEPLLRPIVDRTLCTDCGTCASVCNAGALKMVGRLYTIEEVMGKVMQDKEYYHDSGGGVTVSGGEPLMQSVFVKNLLMQIKQEGIHTAVETAGLVQWKDFETVLDYTDLFLFDVKPVLSEKHQKGTGSDNSLILENLIRLSETDKDIIVRIPLIPGFNMSQSKLQQSGEMLKKAGIKRIELIPYHRLGKAKYEALGRNYLMEEVLPPSPKEVQRLVEYMEKNLNIVVRGVEQ